MPGIHVRLPDSDDFAAALDTLRGELQVPDAFGPEVLDEADRALAAGPRAPTAGPVLDRRDLELVTVDPPSAQDLDQAFAAARRGAGYRVHYAIADVAAFVAPGGSIDREARRRGVTLYAPDHNTLLHPPQLAEGAASLLPGEERQALLWTIDLGPDGEMERASVARALVRSREKASYAEVQQRIDDGTASTSLALLAEIGRHREEIEAERGAVSLNLPAQEVTRHDDHYDLEYDIALPVEGWNAQVSLLTGMAAAEMMIDGRVGLLRTLPEPRSETVAGIRRVALALGVDWPAEMTYAERVRTIRVGAPAEAAFLHQAARGLRGAGYVAFDGEVPEYTRHSAIAADYAHVTAPLRRVCDRFANEVVVALSADRNPPAWAIEALDELPSVMGRARSADRALERGVIDLAEAVALEHRVGETFEGTVVDIDDERARLQVTWPAVIAAIDPDRLELGDHLPVRLVEADPSSRLVRFEPAP
ncbi:MAG: RNB domain-containing ribonuclease [Acidimicrobiia bacterium]|nr:RNB domain-containing ribonuclease [Acidimicrobiia bacterium]